MSLDAGPPIELLDEEIDDEEDEDKDDEEDEDKIKDDEEDDIILNSQNRYMNDKSYCYCL